MGIQTLLGLLLRFLRRDQASFYFYNHLYNLYKPLPSELCQKFCSQEFCFSTIR